MSSVIFLGQNFTTWQEKNKGEKKVQRVLFKKEKRAQVIRL
jgi:hypothetical protein